MARARAPHPRPSGTAVPRPPARGAFPSATLAAEYQYMLERLRAVRSELGLTQADVGRRLGRPDQFVSKSESGERRLDPVDLWRFARAYGRPLSAFLPPVPEPDPLHVATTGD